MDGLTSLLDVWAKWYAPKYPTVFLAAILENIYRETGGRMVPVLETYASNRATAAVRLQKAFVAGKLPWVKTRYWLKDVSGQIAVGGGHIQLTHRDNYLRAESRLKDLFGVDVPLGKNYDLILDPVVSAHVAMSGMIHGWFTSEDLYDHLEKDGSMDWVDLRSIVNGDEKSIAKELKTAGTAFWEALRVSGADKKFGLPEVVLYFPGEKAESIKSTPALSPTVQKSSGLAALIEAVVLVISKMFGGRSGKV